jgi:hypothetical protein
LYFNGGVASTTTSTVLINSPLAANILNSTQSFSIVTWFLGTTSDATYGAGLVSIQRDWSSIGIDISPWGGGGQIYGSLHSPCNNIYYGGTPLSSRSFIDNQWHQAVFSRNLSGLLQVFVDGKLFASQSLPFCNWSFTSPSWVFNIGLWGYYNNYYYNGLISNTRLYDYALTPSQIQAIYNAKQ